MGRQARARTIQIYLVTSDHLSGGRRDFGPVYVPSTDGGYFDKLFGLLFCCVLRVFVRLCCLWLSFYGRVVDALAVEPMKDVVTCDKPRGAGSEL